MNIHTKKSSLSITRSGQIFAAKWVIKRIYDFQSFLDFRIAKGNMIIHLTLTDISEFVTFL